jgi:hypothetical protein
MNGNNYNSMFPSTLNNSAAKRTNQGFNNITGDYRSEDHLRPDSVKYSKP